MTENIRVQKLISNYGYCSRRKAETLIEEGRVSVNGKKITIGDKAGTEDKIAVDGQVLKPEPKAYLVFHKPPGCVTALRDEQYKTVMDFIKVKQRVFPVGRLDYNTTGVLILTNDGDFANLIMHPSNEVKKTYLVQLNRAVAYSDLKKIEKGIELEDGLTSPAKTLRLEPPDMVEVTIHEGKNRIIKRMFNYLGYKVLGLHRERIGELTVKGINPGRCKNMTKKEIEKLVFKNKK